MRSSKRYFYNLFVSDGSIISSGVNQTIGNVFINTTLGSSSVGINTSSPNYALDVFGSSNISDSLFVNTISTSNLHISNNLNVAGTLTVLNITTTNLMDTNLTAGIVRVNDQLSAIGNSNTLGSLFTTAGNVGIGTTSPSVTLDIIGNSSISGNVTIGSNLIISGPVLQIPIGNIADRPVIPQSGSIRYNTETLQFEGYGAGSAWGSLGGVTDIPQTTKILASATPNTTDGNLYFYTSGQERMRINSSGNLGIGTTSPQFNLDVIGNAGISSLNSTNITTTNIIATNFTASNFIANNVNYGITSVFSGSFSASNNVTTPTDITGFQFDNNNVRSFQSSIIISIVRNIGTNLYQNYVIDGIQTDSGWSLYISTIGDITGLDFNITPSGQMQYTSSNQSNFVSCTIKFSVSQISNTGSYSPSGNLTQGTFLIDSIQIQNTKNSITGTDPGSLYVLGGSTLAKGVNILTTENSFGLGTGGGLTVLGGAAISKNLLVGGTITTGNLEITELTNTLNLTSTNISSSNLLCTNISGSNLTFTNISSSNLLCTNISGSNLTFTNISSSNVLCTNVSGSNLNLSNDLNVAGTLTVVNITSSNLMDTNLTAGIARITSNLAATGNSNTIGNIFTTGGNVGIGTTNPSKKLDIIGIIKATGLEINDVTNAFMPRGGIIMWSGSVASIPSGWVLCDGTNGTPDLRGRFIIGSNVTYSLGTSGGSTTKTLTTANMPAHSHSGSTSQNGNHNHGGATNAGGGFQTGFGNWTESQPDTLVISRNPSFSYTLSHAHSINSDGNHAHTFTTDSQGSGTAFDIMPPYYSLAFIMKS